MNKKTQKLAAWLIGAGGILLGLVQVKEYLNPLIKLPDLVYVILLISGLLSFIAAIILFVVGFFVEYIENSGSKIYECVLAKESELEDLHEFAESVVPGVFASKTLWKERFRKNSKIFYLVKAIEQNFPRKSETIVGGFCLLPITESTRKLIENEQLPATEFRAENIASASEKPAAIYIAWVLAKGFSGKSHTLSLLNAKLQLEKSKGITKLYTKPSTDDGLRLVRKYKFLPVNPTVDYQLNRIHTVDIRDIS